jgi:class 3 adenylate cyclase
MAEWVRKHPEQPPEEVASRFHVPVEFVREVFDAKGDSFAARSPLRHRLQIAKSRLRDAWHRFGEIYADATEQPIRFLILSTGMALLMMIFIGVLEGFIQASGNQAAWSVRDEVVIQTILITLGALHSGCYMRHGTIRLPLRVSLWIFVLLLSVSLAGFFFFANDDVGLSRATEAVALGVFVSAVLAALYFLFGAVFSLIGTYISLRESAVLKSKLSRQDLIKRYFELKEKVASASNDPNTYVRLSARYSGIRDTSRYLFLALGTGLAVGLLEVLLMGLVQRFDAIPMLSQSTFALSTIIASAAFGTVAYFAGSLRKAIAAMLVMIVVMRVPHLIPYGNFGPERVLQDLTQPQDYVLPVFWLALGALVGTAAYLEDRAYRRNRLKEDDPASMVAEMIELQDLLAPKRGSACVLVVDVSKSTRMKANADPLDVEWSFREFQTLVSSQVVRFEGRVLSTAGDGAVATFANAEKALVAARELHDGLGRFNEIANRLNEPFRIRVGLHQGETDAELNDVQFNQLIDIAAHVQEVAPVGGIGVTETVLKELPEIEVAEISAPVDDHRVFFVLNPHQT